MPASELLLRRVIAARNGAALDFREGEMSRNYSQVDIDGSGKLVPSDFPLATIGVVGAIVAVKLFLLTFLLVSI
jgi:hypothetical protein